MKLTGAQYFLILCLIQKILKFEYITNVSLPCGTDTTFILNSVAVSALRFLFLSEQTLTNLAEVVITRTHGVAERRNSRRQELLLSLCNWWRSYELLWTVALLALRNRGEVNFGFTLQRTGHR